jgi:RHS repeat-associated protein
MGRGGGCKFKLTICTLTIEPIDKESRQSYAAENRLTQVSGAATASFGYDGDGKRVIGTEGGATTVYIGNYFEWHGVTEPAVKYYYAGGQRVAMRVGGNAATYLMGDHLGSTSVAVDANGSNPAWQLYKAWGETRAGSVPTKYQYTGQYNNTELGLYFYNARWYDPALGRFAQADSIVPEASQGVQAWDRYAGMNNNPVRYNDPGGYSTECAIGDYGCEVGKVSFDGLVYLWTDYSHRFSRSDIYSQNPPKEFLLDLAYNVHCPKCHQWTPEDEEKYRQETELCNGQQGFIDCLQTGWEIFISTSQWPFQDQGKIPPDLWNYYSSPDPYFQAFLDAWTKVATVVDGVVWIIEKLQNHTPQPKPVPIPTPPILTPPQKTPRPR